MPSGNRKDADYDPDYDPTYDYADDFVGILYPSKVAKQMELAMEHVPPSRAVFADYSTYLYFERYYKRLHDYKEKTKQDILNQINYKPKQKNINMNQHDPLYHKSKMHSSLYSRVSWDSLTLGAIGAGATLYILRFIRK